MTPAQIKYAALALCGWLTVVGARADAQQSRQSDDANSGNALAAASVLAPTSYPVLSRDVSRLWFAPTGSRAGSVAEFVEAMKVADQQDHARALPLLSRPSVRQGPLGTYAIYYAALASLDLGRPAEARDALRALQARGLVGFLAEAALTAEAECAEALGDHAGAIALYERLTAARPTAPDVLWMRLGGAAKAAGDLGKARDAFGRVYFDFPFSELSALAGSEYDALPNVERAAPFSQRYSRELARANALFHGGRHVEARQAFERVRGSATGDERDLIQLRLAQIQYHVSRPREARDGLRPFIDKGPRQAEALYFFARASRNVGDQPTYVRTARRIADRFPDERWAEEALNSLATHYILLDEEAQADALFRELYAKYPKSVFAERAAWKAGWWAYRHKRHADTVAYFERAAADFPRSNYRPAWLYWSGRSHEQLNHPAQADERYLLAAADYLNSYYGRLAVAQLDGRRPPPRVVADEALASSPPPPNEPLIRTLLDARRYDAALNELRYAQRAWGDSPSIQATVAWILRQQGLEKPEAEQFALLRGSITTMRRAYPQFMAAGGEDLPRDVLTHIFPIAYWDLIQKYSAQYKLDRYLLAALMAQESTFVPAVRSSAGAVGLMQLMPATARTYARRLKLTYSARLLTDPEANVRMGTAYLADKIREFGELHLALASYNAGEKAVRTWKAERPGLPRDEFIDDIPYPETQNYVKRILGTADDYRRLYGS